MELLLAIFLFLIYIILISVIGYKIFTNGTMNLGIKFLLFILVVIILFIIIFYNFLFVDFDENRTFLGFASKFLGQTIADSFGGLLFVVMTKSNNRIA